jgi:hypothetical protein
VTGAVYIGSDGTAYAIERMPVPFAARTLAKYGATLEPDVRAALETRASLAVAGAVADAGALPNGVRMLRTGGRFAARAGDNYSESRRI